MIAKERKGNRKYADVLKALKLVLRTGGLPAVILAVAVIGNGALSPLSVWLTKKTIDTGIDRLSGDGDIQTFLSWIILLILVLVVYNIRELTEMVLKIRITHRLRDNLVPIIAQKYERMKYSCFENSKTADLISRIGNSPEKSIANMFWDLLYIPNQLVTLLGLAMLYFSSGWWILAGCVLLMVPSLYISIKNVRENLHVWRSQTLSERMAGYISSLMTGREAANEMRLFGLFDYLNAKWFEKKIINLNERMKFLKRQNSVRMLENVLNYIFLLRSICIFLYSLLNGKMSFGKFVALVSSLPQLVQMITWLIPYSISQFETHAMYCRELDEFLNLPEEDDSDRVSVDFKEEIRFDDVYFKYPDTDKYILNGVSFALRRGEKIAVVGENGAGKSTIIKLLLGLYRPDSGSITIDGVDIGNINNASRKKLFAAVFQDFCSYSLTLRENIAFGYVSEIHNDQKINEALAKTGSESIVSQLPGGLETILGKVYEGGTDLSYGQWQRVAISRAVFSDAEVMILDEPTAAIDPAAETEIYKSFARSAEDKTCILISHRLGIARIADRVIVIKGGRVVEEGTHDELMSSNTLYKTMFDAQAQWYRERDTEKPAVEITAGEGVTVENSAGEITAMESAAGENSAAESTVRESSSEGNSAAGNTAWESATGENPAENTSRESTAFEDAETEGAVC